MNIQLVCVTNSGSAAAELERLGDEIAQLAAHVHAATYALLVRLLEFDRRGGWSGGFRSCAHWLSWRTGIAPGAAREKVRVARALEQLPAVSEAMRRGELSFAKARAITRVATPKNESSLLDVARHGTAAHVEMIVRAWRRVDRLEEVRVEQRQHDGRYLNLREDEDGMYELRGRLTPEVGAFLQRALEAGVETLYGRRPARGDHEVGISFPIDRATAEQRRADAVGLIAEWALAQRSAPEGPSARQRPLEVVLHVEASALPAGSTEGQAIFADGARVSAETSRRVCCDSSRVIMRHDAEGNVLDVGRRSRTIPVAIRRALVNRDRTCRFPGCESKFCDAHHIEHWADGGPTRLTNLVLLCRTHHRAVHEGGYRVEYAETGELRFLTPKGWILPNTTPTLPLGDDPVRALQAAHQADGLEIGGTTGTPRWNGERLDLDFALLTLRRV